jgi:hypothetical protein
MYGLSYIEDNNIFLSVAAERVLFGGEAEIFSAKTNLKNSFISFPALSGTELKNLDNKKVKFC